METSDDLKIAQSMAAWTACRALSKGDVAQAMYQAGLAIAYFNARDVVDTLEEKLKASRKRKKTS